MVLGKKSQDFNEISRTIDSTPNLSFDEPYRPSYNNYELDELPSPGSDSAKEPLFVRESDSESSALNVHSDNEQFKRSSTSIDSNMLWRYRKVFALSFLVSLNGFLFGYDTALIGGIINMKPFINTLGHVVKDEITGIEEIVLKSYQTGLIVSTYHIGCITGGFTIGRLADTLGRRIPILIAIAVYITGILIQMATTFTGWWLQFLVGRFTTGLCIGSVAVLTPMLISETAPAIIRGSCVCFYGVNVTGAILVGSIVIFQCKETFTSDAEWLIPLFIGVLAAAIAALGILLTPESARYLISKNDYYNAKKSLQQIGEEDIDDTIEAIQEKLMLEQSAHDLPFTVIFEKRYRKRVLIGVFMMIFQQMSGIDYFFYYGTALFQYAGVKDSYFTAIILAGVNFAVTIPTVYAIERFGRRRALLIGSTCCCLFLFVYSTVGSFSLNPNAVDQSENKIPGMIMVIFTCLFIIFFSPTLGASVGVLISELYPLHIKSKAVAFGTAFNWGSNFFIGLGTPIISELIGYKFGYVFSGFMFAGFWFVYFMVPETQGVSLEEISALFEN